MSKKNREISEIKVVDLTIEEFKSIKKSKCTFTKGLNIIIGPNGSGKSNLLQIINLTTSLTSINNRIRSQMRYNTSYSINLSFKENNISNRLKIVHEKSKAEGSRQQKEKYNEIQIYKKAGKIVKSEFKIKYADNDYSTLVKNNQLFNELTILRRLRKRFIKFNLPADEDSSWIHSPSKLIIDEDGYITPEDFSSFTIMETFIDDYLNFESEQLTSYSKKQDAISIKNHIIQLYKKFNNDYCIDESLSRHSPINETRLNNNINIYFIEDEIHIENLILEYKVNDNWIPWSYLSDGTKRLFYIVTQSLSIKGGILIIEEPEIGIHPKQLFSLMTFFKEQSITKQIFISTHSPIVLDVLSPEELGCITITRYEKNGTRFRKLSAIEKEKAKTYMSTIGELSYYWLHSDLENE